MRKTTTLYLILCFSFFCGGMALQAEQTGNSPAKASPCGPDCTCGCLEGKPCTCGASKSCGDGCDCGCAEGNPCTCHDACCGSVQDWSILIYQPCGEDCRMAYENGLTGIWMPEDPFLFRTFIADPREITYGVGWRFNDQQLVKNVIDVSFGDSFPIYRWCDVWPWNGALQIELEGALWAVFDPLHDSAPLMNADYYCGVPITYAIENWQFRLRGYHISCHTGDEFLLNHPSFDRRNPSAEFLDFFVSHDFNPQLRLYGGVGWVVAMDDSFKTGRFYAEAGTELHLTPLGFIDCRQKLYGVPFYAMHFRYRTHDFKNHVDATYALGYEFGKTCGLCRKARFYLEYHDGYSLEGQYQNFPTNYLSIRMTYGF